MTDDGCAFRCLFNEFSTFGDFAGDAAKGNNSR